MIRSNIEIGQQLLNSGVADSKPVFLPAGLTGLMLEFRCRSLKVESFGDESPGNNGESGGLASELRKLEFIAEYRVYNREKEIERMERERKERQWEEELNTAMMSAEEMRLKYGISISTRSQISASIFLSALASCASKNGEILIDFCVSLYWYRPV